VRTILLQLERTGPEVVWLLFPYAAGTAVAALPWLRLLPVVWRPSFRSAVASRFAASGANALLPFFGMAGEPARLLWLRKDAHAPGLAALVLDRVVYNASSALFLLFGGAVGWALTPLPSLLGGAAFLTAALILVATLGAYWAALRWGIGARLQYALRRVLGRSYEAPEFGPRVDAELHALLAGKRRELWRCATLHFCARAVLALEVWVTLWILDVPADTGRALVVASVPLATSLFASSIPSQLGVQEASQELVCTALGFAPGVGLSLVLLQRGRQLVFVALTPLLLASARERH